MSAHRAAILDNHFLLSEYSETVKFRFKNSYSFNTEDVRKIERGKVGKSRRAETADL